MSVKGNLINSNSLSKMLKLVNIEHDRHFFEELLKIISEQFKEHDICFLSSSNKDEENPKKMRIMAGKNIANENFWNKVTKVGKDHCFYYLGNKKSQYYFLVCHDLRMTNEDLNILQSLVESYFELSMKIEEYRKGQDLIYIDDVTGLFNQRKLNIDLNYYVDHYKNHGHAFCVLFIDVDFFKKVNDGHGHLVGTRILEMMAKEIKVLLRDADLLYRYGGDEFVVLLPDTNLEGGKIVGERILQKIKNHNFNITTVEKELSLTMTLSIGVAECPNDATNVEELLSFADKMMYGAKSTGRGTVFYAHEQLGKMTKRA